VHRRALRRPVGLVVASLFVLSCTNRGAQPSSVPLPTLDSPLVGCADVALVDATLQGDPADSRVAWLTAGANRIDVVWPPGYRAIFSPRLEVLDASAHVVLRVGDQVHGGCSVQGAIYIEPPF
jgi:hypothetical protein